YFMCFNDAISLGFGGSEPPCFNATVERVALLDASLTGASALSQEDADRFLDMVSHVLGRFGAVSRDGAVVTVAPPVRRLANCGGSTVTVPVGARRVLAVATTDAVTGKEDDDRIAFDCAGSGSDSPN